MSPHVLAAQMVGGDGGGGGGGGGVGGGGVGVGPGGNILNLADMGQSNLPTTAANSRPSTAMSIRTTQGDATAPDDAPLDLPFDLDAYDDFAMRRLNNAAGRQGAPGDQRTTAEPPLNNLEDQEVWRRFRDLHVTST
ncbi:hypothetical protein HK104_003352 [Borealophlyctis nickersoniae]|nr:hypothetical protein HK104_003352 [Borealophlyctis nickersoniae]